MIGLPGAEFGCSGTLEKVNVLSKSDQFISCYVSTVNNEVYFNATFVYGDNDPSLRRVVWRELRSCAAMIKTMLHGWS